MMTILAVLIITVFTNFVLAFGLWFLNVLQFEFNCANRKLFFNMSIGERPTSETPHSQKQNVK